MAGIGGYPAEPPSDLPLIKRGKVRDVFDAGPDKLLIAATDRISAFDVVLEPGVPGKGIILNQLSNFWFESLASLVPNHLLATDPAEFPHPFTGRPE
ncbi:phosphoribosylaminoimidazolesuccinocarboxamide synthase, partial [Arthrospira platensis SPKY1]|nr:phosphoribosylaminoimidazolesuccinocarboxamide synthase [Arthrospira platensis SPKY1]